MGVYVYTLRKNTIKTRRDLGGIIVEPEIGYAQFAYKCWNGWDEPGYFRRQVGRAHAFAEKARQANPDLDLITLGNPKEHDFERAGAMPVFQVSTDANSWCDTKDPGPVVGYLRKNGRKYGFETLADARIAA